MEGRKVPRKQSLFAGEVTFYRPRANAINSINSLHVETSNQSY